MRSFSKFIGLILSIALLNSCQDDTFKEYYYQLEDYQEPKFFYYKCLGHPNLNQYWKVSSNLKDQTLTTEAYDIDFDKIEYFKEKYTDEGSFLVEYYMIEGGIPIKTKPRSTSVFLWDQKKSYDFSVQYSQDGIENHFRKRRKYSGPDQIEIMGQMIDVIKMDDSYEFSEVYSAEGFQFKQVTYYSKEYSYVKYIRTFEEGHSVTFELQEILTEKEWEELRKEK